MIRSMRSWVVTVAAAAALTAGAFALSLPRVALPLSLLPGHGHETTEPHRSTLSQNRVPQPTAPGTPARSVGSSLQDVVASRSDDTSVDLDDGIAGHVASTTATSLGPVTTTTCPTASREDVGCTSGDG